MNKLSQFLMMAASSLDQVNFISSSINNVTSNRDNTVVAPSGIIDNDIIIAYGYSDSVNRSLTIVPSGFTVHQSSDSASSNNASYFIASKLASSESGNYAFRWNANASNTIALLVYRNATNSSRLIGAETGSTTSTSTAASITPTIAGALVACFGINSNRTITTAPSGMDLLVSQTASTPSVAIYGITPNPTGATGNKTLVWSGANANSGIQMQIHGI
jgi:hypothetical protein